MSTRRPHSYLMWFKWLHEATRIGDGASPMRGQPEDGCYRKTWKKMMEPDYEFRPELDEQTAG